MSGIAYIPVIEAKNVYLFKSLSEAEVLYSKG